MKKFYCAIGFVCILAAILCMLCIDTKVDVSSSIEYKEYGGDAYTDIQNGIATTANSISDTNQAIGQLLEAIQLISFFSFMIVGMFAFAKAGKLQIEENLAKDNNRSTSNSRIRCPFCGCFHDLNCKECPICGHKY